MSTRNTSKSTSKMSSSHLGSWNTQQPITGQGRRQLQATDMSELLTPYIDDASQWAHAHTSVTGYDYFHPLPATANYSSPPADTLSYGSYPQGSFSTGLSYNTTPSFSYSPQPSFGMSNYTMSPNLSQTPAVYGSTMHSQFSSSMVPSMSTAFGGSRGSSPRPSTSTSDSTSSSYATSSNPRDDLSPYGTLNPQTRTWTCAYPSCSSKAIFVRPCDLRKHFNRHSKNFFCRYEGCPQSESRQSSSGSTGGGGFSSKKDRARHESKHNPGVICEWEGCERVFSRVDNMRNHLSRIHHKNRPN